MPYTFTDRLKHAWNAFTSRDPTFDSYGQYGQAYYPRSSYHNGFYGDQSIVTMVENKIAVDVAQVNIRHVRTDENGNYQEEIPSSLNKALSISANVDQTGRNLIQDAVMSMFDEGHIVIVPTETDYDPLDSGRYDILSLRVGKVLEWYPKHVKVELWNELLARKDSVVLPKAVVAIIENPFYSIMNEHNSTLKRLIRTLRNIDVTNDNNMSGKMDLIIQLPYALRTPLKQQQAESRRKQIERQLVNSKYGIAYTDAAERITQLNRPVENNLWKEASDLTQMLFNQLGLTQAVFDGTADEKMMNNYYNRTIEPILSAITEEMHRKFLTKTARTQRQAIVFIRDPFKMTTLTDIANTASILITNRTMSPNEVRSKLGLPPDDSQQANELVNPNIDKVSEMSPTGSSKQTTTEPIQNETESNEET